MKEERLNSLVTVSIVTWNNSDTIESCIESLLVQTHKNIQIIISDNNSSDNTYEIICRYKNRAEIFNQKKNIGFCGGQNYNIKKAEGDYILLANPDAIFKKDYIEEALKTIQKSHDYGTVCGVLIKYEKDNYDSGIIDSAGLKITRSRRMKLIGNSKNVCYLPKHDFEVFGADGAAPMYRGEMIKDLSIGGQLFDKMFFAHKEDHDISWRARLFGWKAVCSRQAFAIHPRHFSPGDASVRKQIPAKVKYHAVKNQFLMQLKNEHLSNFIIDIPWIVVRQFIIFAYILFFEQSSLKSYLFVLRNMKGIIRKRRIIQKKKTATWSDIRKWIGRSWIPLR